MQIGVLTTFVKFSQQYSLCSIVKEQIEVLEKNGYDVTLIAIEGCEFPNAKKIRYMSHVYLGATLQEVKKDFEAKVNDIYTSYNRVLTDFHVILTHDIMFQSWFLPYNAALRRFAKDYPQIRWLHWMHSAPSARPNSLTYPDSLRYSEMVNSIWITMNYTDLPLIAKMYNIPEANVRVVYNSRNPQNFFDMAPLSKQLIEEHDLLAQDILMVYPLDITRFISKGGKKAIKLLNSFIRLGKKAKLIFCDAWANTEKQKTVVKSHSSKYVIFTSSYKGYELGVPKQVIRDLMLISNVFFIPSVSEGCSLIMLEAALTKNLIILNEDFPPSREFGEINHALYMKLSSERGRIKVTTTYSDENAYYEKKAKEILVSLDNNPALKFNRKVLQKFNADWIFKNQLEPLIKEK